MTSGRVPAFGGYLVERELGRGGMGIVYRAVQQATGRPVALKLLLAARDPILRARFQREVSALARLRHAGIVELIHAGEHDGTPFLALELVDGGSLRDRLRAGPLPPAQAAGLVADVARAVQAAHDAGVIHRDLKPANVLLTRDGRPRVVDFGIARCFDSGEKLTQTGSILGSSHYLSPEQLESAHEVDARTDVYGLGAILYEALTGSPPFAAHEPPSLWSKILGGPAPGPRERVDAIPAALDATCRKAMATNRAERHPTALDLALELDRAAGRVSRRSRPARARRARSFAVPLVVVAVGLGGVALGVAFTRPPAPEQPAARPAAPVSATVVTPEPPVVAPPTTEPEGVAPRKEEPGFEARLAELEGLGDAKRWDDAVALCRSIMTEHPTRCGEPGFVDRASFAGRRSFPADTSRSFFDDSAPSPRVMEASTYFEQLLGCMEKVGGGEPEGAAFNLVIAARLIHARTGPNGGKFAKRLLDIAITQVELASTHLARGEWLAARGEWASARSDLIDASNLERTEAERRQTTRLLSWVTAHQATEAGERDVAVDALARLIQALESDVASGDGALLERARARLAEWSGR